MTVDLSAASAPRRTRRLRTMVLAIAMAASCLASSAAITRKPLPAFVVTDLESRIVESPALAQAGNWLLVYLQSGCADCGDLLQLIDPKTHPAAVPRTVIIVGGMDAGAVAKAAAAFPHLAGARWLADPDRSLARVLPVASAPVVFGLREQMLEWSIAGLVPNASAVRSALMTWIGNTPR